jgi:dynein light chain 1
MATSVKDAIKAFEASAECVAAEAEDVRLCPIALQLPLISKMDGSLGTLKACKHLRLSTNAIDKIANLNGLDNLEILSLGRNAIKSLNGIDPVADTLKQLWISYNQIASLAGVEKLQNLEVLFMSNNKINSWSEVERLANCSKLRDLLLKGNPLESTCEAGDWRIQIIKRLPGLKVRAGLAQRWHWAGMVRASLGVRVPHWLRPSSCCTATRLLSRPFLRSPAPAHTALTCARRP